MWQLLFLMVSVQAQPRLDPLVDTKQGLIRGLRADDGDYAMFLGIPYAQVDENNPFGLSHPYPKFEQVFEAYDGSAKCPQSDRSSKNVVGSLDCLHLHIYVPNKASTRNKLPVMVWIHGGGLETGSASGTGPKYLIQHDVILVAINYRLGPYGFMCLDIPEVSGNQGLKDQTIALKWIKENIEQFGGDINKITIFGGSAGGASVGQHLVSNNEKLYNQVIMQSGNALTPWATRDTDTTVPLKISKHLGFDTENVYSALEFLKQTDVNLVIAAATELEFAYGACVEKEFDGVESFMTEHSASVDVVQKARNMNILIGYNSLESLYDYSSKTENQLNTDDPFERLLPLAFEVDRIGDTEKIIRHFYLGDNAVSAEQINAQILFDSDIKFSYPTQRSVERYINSEAKSVYSYVFSFTGNRNLRIANYNTSLIGAAHGDEMGYLFHADKFTEASDDEQLIIDRMTQMWTNFAKYGNPTPEITELLPVLWPPASQDSLTYLDISKNLSVSARPFHFRLAFWDLIYETYKDSVKGAAQK